MVLHNIGDTSPKFRPDESTDQKGSPKAGTFGPRKTSVKGPSEQHAKVPSHPSPLRHDKQELQSAFASIKPQKLLLSYLATETTAEGANDVRIRLIEAIHVMPKEERAQLMKALASLRTSQAAEINLLQHSIPPHPDIDAKRDMMQRLEQLIGNVTPIDLKTVQAFELFKLVDLFAEAPPAAEEKAAWMAIILNKYKELPAGEQIDFVQGMKAMNASKSDGPKSRWNELLALFKNGPNGV